MNQALKAAALRRVVDHILALVPQEVDALGHRIVHGGEYFRDPVIVERNYSGGNAKALTNLSAGDQHNLERATWPRKQWADHGGNRIGLFCCPDKRRTDDCSANRRFGAETLNDR